MSRRSTPVARLEQDGRQPCSSRHTSIALVELIMTAALALSTAVAATAISIGMARAEVSATADTARSAVFPMTVGVTLSFYVVPGAGPIMAAGQATGLTS